MEEVERTNTVIARSQQQGVGLSQRNPYAIEIDRGNQNYYICGGFRHIARNCKNRKMGINRRINQIEDNNNLNGNRGLESSN